MMELTESLRLVYANATEESGDEVSDIMKELRKSQSALKKVMDCKQQELHQTKSPQPLTVLPAETLSSLELQDMVKDIIKESSESAEHEPKVPDSNTMVEDVKNETVTSSVTLSDTGPSELQDLAEEDYSNELEMIEMDRPPSVVSESSSCSQSPVIPILTGLDTYKSFKYNWVQN